jgi:hypothetical protein
MRISRRLAVCTAATGLLTLGGITAGMTAAQANTAGFCNGTGTTPDCTVTETIAAPTSISVAITASTNEAATVSWTVTCGTASSKGGATAETPVTEALTLPVASPNSCTASATITLATSTASNTVSVAMTYTVASTTPTPPPVTASGKVVQGYHNKCVDDSKNSTANGAKVVIWSCNHLDKAQLWTYSSGELVHNGKCLNDAGWGGSGTKVILYSCDKALNELWTHLSNGEYVLNAKGYKLCLDDPASSTKNGTRLIIYSCKDSANQKWHLAA